MEKKTPLVSIALATYNGSAYLEEQINSVLQQTWKNIEIIISDDASTDNTLEIVTSFAIKHPKIKIFKSDKNRGFIKNFEFALRQCRGDFIALCDQDDVWRHDKIEKLMSIIGEYDMAASDLSVIDKDGNLISPSMEKYQGLYVPSAEDMFQVIVLRNCFTGCAMLVTKSLVAKSLPIPKAVLAHDWWFSINASVGNGIVYTRETLVNYRQHDKNTIGAKNKKKVRIETLLKTVSPKRRKYMKNRFHDFTDRINTYIEVGSFNEDQIEYLKDIRHYYIGYLSFLTKWKTIYYGIKHRKYIYINKSLPRVLINLVGKLI